MPPSELQNIEAGRRPPHATRESRAGDGGGVGTRSGGSGTEIAPVPRGMLHLFHLGPLTLGERSLWLLSAVDEEGAFTHPVLEAALPAGVAAVAARHGAEHLRAEPALTEFAAPLEIESAPLPAEALKPRAVLAFAFANAHALFRSPSVIATFLEACTRFGDVAPWAQFTSRQAFRAVLTEGSRQWTREAAVLGSDEDCGLALYDRPGSAERLAQALQAGRLTTARRIDSLSVLFQAGPAWAADAVQAAYGLPEFPSVVRFEHGSSRGPEPLELLHLGAALRAVALLAGEDASPDFDAQVELSADGYEVRAIASLPERAASRSRAAASV
jgi:hypothetical protein